MALDPHMQALLEQFAGAFALDFAQLDAATYRGFADQSLVAGEPLTLAEVRELRLLDDLPARLYRPSAAAGLPLLVFFHGGGFVAGTLDTHDDLCRRIALGSGAVVVSVGYRLAPEAPFPAAPNDCCQAVAELVARAAELEVDATRLALAGDSAGGNLAIAAARLLSQRGGPIPGALCLLYPVTDQSCGSASYREFASGHFLEASMMHWFWRQYLGSWPAPLDVLASPLHAADLGALPRTLLMSAECDPLRDEGEAFAERARAAGADVECVRAEGMLHGFASFAPFVPRAQAYLDDAAAWLRDVLR
ncbi:MULTISPECIES: alpha/beta hydrolase [Pseudomonas]|uniref:alpha/beta hydrolase n=1 Tax=Pseudomonas TaxID=286 RepID=UPI0006D3B481|nr:MULTISPECIES: alpha/beta hydrolase [Pseudomonas]MCE4069367.1 alpha/beta hydrolase [Pseudomonas nitritireducens]MCE4079469.1 alpha/beta hydrolase [Pseudomonas nitroreducens]OBY91949.1 esterase [Pseudomonas sp. AU11447]